MLKEYLEVTEMLNFRSQEIQKLVVKKHWSNLTEYNKIKSIYEFVQNDILFCLNNRQFMVKRRMNIEISARHFE